MECKDGVCPVPWATEITESQAEAERVVQLTDEQEEVEFEALTERPVLTDNVNHPAHYTDGSIECIEAIEAQLTPEEYRGYLKGNCVKYLWREKHKGGTESLEKAQWYLNRLVDLDKSLL